MRSNALKFVMRGAWGAGLSLFAVSAIAAQARVVLPEGSVIIVRTEVPLESSTARVGQTFETTVDDSVGVDNYTVIPAGSRIRGVIGYVQPATRQRSGVIQVTFDRLTLADGTSYPIVARLTSTDATERRQIDADPNARVVLVGGRGGIGAAVAGAGSDKSPVSGILSALGNLLSAAQDVQVPAGTPLAVQLDQRVVLRGRGAARGASDAFTIYTDQARIRAAQRALTQQNYYHGPINGVLDDATQRALFEFQVDKGMVGTGNLDGRTAQALGLVTSGPLVPAAGRLSAEEASLLRRGALALAARERQELSVSAVGQLDARRTYSQADLDLWFALSAFADNASLYEQLVRSPGNTEGATYAGSALLAAARRGDAALQSARTSTQIQNAWAALRQQLTRIDPSYTTGYR
jgi:hypothetical protein